jgi:hypothetical protein
MTLNLYQKNIPELLELDKIELNEEGEAASLCFLRAQRFIEGYYVEEEITELYIKFFGDTNVNQKNGLVKQYQSMKDYVISKNKIGLILVGANLHHILIDTYPTLNNTVIDLTVRGISRILLRNHFTNDEVVDFCRNTPNFHIYYKPEE